MLAHIVYLYIAAAWFHAQFNDITAHHESPWRRITDRVSILSTAPVQYCLWRLLLTYIYQPTYLLT